MRGPLYGEADEQIPAELGVMTIPWTDLVELGPRRFAEQAGRRIGKGPTF